MRNKKIFLFSVGLTVLTLAFIAGVSHANAATSVAVQGDMPEDAVNYFVRVYDETSADPCPGVGALGSDVTATGDATYNDDNDYSITGLTTADADISIYFCRSAVSGDLVLKYENMTVANSITYSVDLGKVIGSTLHDDLDNDYVVACTALDGTQISSEDSQVSAALNSYTQYYPVDCGAGGASCPASIYILFDQNNVAECTWDSDKSTGKKITVDSSAAENYGVYISYAPDTKVTGDLHSGPDLNAVRFEIEDSGSLSVGLATESYTDSGNNPDGAGANDDYTIYYDKPAAGDITVALITVANGTTTIRNVSTTDFDNVHAVGQYDFVNHLTDDGDGLPSDITNVTINQTFTTPADVVDVSSAPHGTGAANNDYDIYTAIAGAADNVLYKVGVNTVFTKAVDFSAEGDDTVDVAKISGETAAGLQESGSPDNIEVFTGNTCAAGEVDSQDFQPTASAGDDYAAYFQDTDVTVYMKVTKDASYTTCGNSILAATFNGDQLATVNLTREVTGTVHTDITRVAVDDTAANSDATDGDSCTAFTNAPLLGVYYLYASTSADLVAPVDADTNVFFTTTGTPSVELLERTKDLSTTGLSLNVGKVTGALHANLQNLGGDGDNVAVYSDNACSSLVSSEDVITGAGASYSQYYEQNGANNFLKVSDQNADGTYTSCGQLLTWAAYGDSQTDDADVLVDGGVPDAVDSVKIDVNKDGSVLIVGNVVETVVDSYKLYFEGDDDAYLQFFVGATKVLERTKDLDPSVTINVAEFSGTISTNAFYEGGTGDVDVYDSYLTLASQYNSTSTLTDADPDTYAVYFEDTGAAEFVDVRFTDDAGYISWANNATASDGTIDAGDNIDFDLEYKLTGTVPADAVYVTVRDSGDTSTVFGVADPLVTGAYILYLADGVGSYVIDDLAAARVWDADNEGTNTDKMEYTVQKPAGTIVYYFTTALEVFAADVTHDVVKVSGSVPGTAETLNGGAVYADAVATVCGATSHTTGEGSGTITDAAAVDTYEVYYMASSAFYLVFCDSGATVDYATTDTTENNFAAGTDKTLYLAALTGKMDTNFAVGAGADMKVYDSFQTTLIGGTDNSEHDGAGIVAAEAAGDYYVFFEQSGTAAEIAALTDEAVRTEADSTADVSLNITDNGSYVMNIVGIEGTEGTTAPAAGDIITVDLVNDLDGTVPVTGGHTDYVVVQDSTDEFCLGTVVAGTGVYRLVCPTVASLGGAANVYYVVESNTADVLNYSTSAVVLSDDTTFDANKITVTTHTDVGNDADDLIYVFSTAADSGDANCSGTLLSSLVTGATPNPEIYFRMTDAATLHVNLSITARETDLYNSCVNTETDQGAAGSAIIYSADKKLSGNLGTGLDYIYFDNDGDSTNWEVKATVLTTTTPDTYKAYWAGDGDTDVKVTSAGPVTELIRTGNNYAADSTFNVGKVTGGAKDALTTAVVYTNVACSGAVSSETEDPGTPVSGQYIQYFEGITGTPYYVAVGDGTYTTCRKTDIALAANQETTNINFNRIVSGTVPDEDTVDAALTGTANSISSVGIDLTGNGTTDEYLSAVVDAGAATTYAIYVDATTGADATNQVNFWGVNDGTGGPLLARQDQSLTSDLTINAAMMYGEAPASLETTANDYVKVCDDNLAALTYSMAGTCTTYLNTNDGGNGITVADNGFGTADYSIYFVVGADTEGYLEVETNDAVVPQGITWAYRRVGTADVSSDIAITAGDIFNVNLDSRMYGKAVEQYDYTTAVPNVQIDVLDNTDTTTAVRGFSNTTGYYNLYDTAGQTRDFSYTKAGYVTKNYSNTTVATDYDTPLNTTAAFNAVVIIADNDVEENAAGEGASEISLGSGIKVTVKDGGTNPITDATVALYTCTAGGDGSNPSACTTWTLNATCANPSGNCTRTGANAAGNGLSGEYYFAGIAASTYVQVRVTDPSSPAVFAAIFSPDPSESVNSFVTSASSQLSATVIPYNPAPDAPTLVSPANGLATVDTTPDLSWVDLGGDESYYEVQVSDDTDFADLHAGGGNTATGAITTWTVDSALTNGVKYYWRVRACDAISNCGDWSASRYFYINTGWNGTIGAPTLGNTAGTLNVTIVWPAIIGAKSYAIYRSDATPIVVADGIRIATTDKINYTDTVATDGTYYYAYTAIDETGAESAGSTTSLGIVVDASALPTVTLSTPIANGYFTAVTGTLAWYDITGETSYTVEVADNSAMTTNLVTVTGLAAGTTSATVGAAQTVNKVLTNGASYYWWVRAIDSAGANAAWSEVRKFTVDATAPTLTVPLPTTTQTSKTFSVSVNGGETGLSCRASIDADANTYAEMGLTLDYISASVYGATISVPADGTYTVYFACQDAAGNETTSNTGAAFTVDTIAPTDLVATPQGGTYKTAQQLSVTTDTASTCYYSTSDVSYDAMVGGLGTIMVDNASVHTATPTPGAQGLIHYYVKCSDDVASNDMLSSAVLYYTYDTTVPTYAFSSMDNATAVKVGTTVTAYYEASEDMATSPTATISGEAATVTRNGRLVKVTVVLTDAAAGNDIVLTGGTDVATNAATTLTDAGRLALDKVVPVLTVPLPTTTQTSKTFSVSVNGGEAGLSCRASIDADANTYAEMGLALDYISANVYGATISVPADGTYTVYFACQDAAGNETATNTGAAFTVDTTAPTDLVISIAGGAEYATAAAATITVAANGATNMQFSCDGDNYTTSEVYATTKSFNLRTQADAGCTDTDGFKTVYVRMLDTYGNSAVLSDDIILDSVVPVITGSTPSVSVSGGQVTVTWTAATDATAGIDTYAVYRNTTGSVTTGDTKVVSGLTAVGFVDAFSADGTYYYGITATDKAGLTSVISTTSTVATVDVTGPAPVSITINSDATYSTSATLTLTLFAGGTPDAMAFSCDGSTWAAEEADATSKSLVLGSYGGGCSATDGVKIVYVKMMDANDNTTYAFDYITLDTSVNTNVTSLLPATNVTQSATGYTWSWTAAADTGSGVDHYYVEVSNDAGSTWTYKTDNVISNTYTLTGLAVNSTGYQIRVTAYDKAGNTGAVVTSAGLLYVGNTATITNVTVGTIATTTAIVSWTTSVNSTSNTVEYGLTSALGSTQATSTGESVTTHSASLTSLTANRTYYYRVKSTAAGQTTYSDILTFVTSADTTGIAVTGTNMMKPYAIADETFANGWKWSMSVTVYNTAETSLKMKMTDWVSGSNTIAIADNMRIGLTNEASAATDVTVEAATQGIGNAYTDQTTALTLVDEDPTKGGIQDTIYLYMEVPSTALGGAYTSSYGIYTY